MLSDAQVFATIAVSDIDAGKNFYGETLGLKQIDENAGGVTYGNGEGKLFVYKSPTAGTGQATAVTWEVPDVGVVAGDLKAKGVYFEHYEVPGAVLQGDVHVMGEMKAAWFKDPDGNIICIANAH